MIKIKNNFIFSIAGTIKTSMQENRGVKIIKIIVIKLKNYLRA